MKIYQEIILRSGMEVNQYFVWQKVFQKVHLRLVELKSADGLVAIGISFPEYKYDGKSACLGSKLRFFAPSEDILLAFSTQSLFRYFSDYIHLTGIRQTPKAQHHATYWRERPRSNLLRMARRKAKRENLSDAEALEQLKGFSEQRTKAPYINVRSGSSERPFRLFIIKKWMEQPVSGLFNCYGLSDKTTVPEF